MDEYLRITSKKMIYLNSSCARELGERCDLYEYGNVTALVSAPFGRFHLGKKSEQCQGKNLCSGEMVKYLINKYKVLVGSRLSAWKPVGENVAAIFLALQASEAEASLKFNSKFEIVSFPYRKRYGEWVYVEDRCISFTAGIREILPSRLSLKGDGLRLALVGDSSGEFIVDQAKGRKGGCINSAALSDYCRKRFNSTGRSMLFHARPIKNGVCFALKEENLLSARRAHTLPQIELALSPDVFVNVNNSYGVYVSSKAVDVLGQQLSLYYADRWLAFGNDKEGNLAIGRTGYQNCIYSTDLQKKIIYFYPCCKKLFLIKNGSLFVLVQQDSNLDAIPPCNRFSRIAALSKEDMRIGKPEVSVYDF